MDTNHNYVHIRKGVARNGRHDFSGPSDGVTKYILNEN